MPCGRAPFFIVFGGKNLYHGHIDSSRAFVALFNVKGNLVAFF